jgi:hypothetical protein
MRIGNGIQINADYSTNVILDMRININKQIQRIHGNYDPASPLMIKKTLPGRAIGQFRTWLYRICCC